MTWEKFDNIKGPKGDKGDPGTISSASAASVAPDQPAEVILSGAVDVHAEFKIPRGAKGDKGDVGPAGTFGAVNATTVPSDQPSDAWIEEVEGVSILNLALSRGLPGTGSATTGEAVGAHLSAPESAARPGFVDGMAQVASDPGSAFSVAVRDAFDADFTAKADLVSGRVPLEQLGAASVATPGTVPLRGDDGQLEAVGTPVADDDAATKGYVDTKITRGQFVRGARLWSYGHSYTKVPSNYTTPNAGEHPLILKRELGFAEVFANGRGGTPLIDTFSLMLSATWDPDAPSRQWPGAVAQAYGSATRAGVDGLNQPRGVVILENYMNEAPYASTSTDEFIAYWGKQLRSALALLSGRVQHSGSSGEVGTGWATVAGEDTEMYPASRLRRSSVVGDYMLYKAWGDEIWIVGHASIGGAYGSGKLDVFVGETGSNLVTTIDVGGIRPAYDSRVRPGNSSRSPLAFKVTGLNAAAGTTGEKIIRVQVKENTNTFQSIAINPREQPPQIIVAKEPPKKAGSEGAALFAVSDPKFRAQIDTVCAEFPNVHVVDLAPGWDNDTMVSSFDTAGFHPNDLGQRHIADKYLAAIESTITGPMPGVLVI